MSVPTTRPEGANPLAEDPKPTQHSAADVQGASAGSAVERREELPPGGLPHARLQPQALQLRWLVSQQVLLRHRPQYLPSSRGTARHPSCPVERVPSTEPAARWPRRRERSTRAPRPHDTGEATKSHGRLDHPSGGPASLFLLWTSESEGWPPDTPARDDEREPRSRLLLHDETEHSEGAPRPTASLLRVWDDRRCVSRSSWSSNAAAVQPFWHRPRAWSGSRGLDPEPRWPRRQSSSPKCAKCEATTARRPTRHRPA
jgi:hypothetical protein